MLLFDPSWQLQYGRKSVGGGGPAQSVTSKRPKSADKQRMGFGGCFHPQQTSPAGKEGCGARPGQGKGICFWLWISAGPGDTSTPMGPAGQRFFSADRMLRGARSQHPPRLCFSHSVSQYLPKE